MAFDLGHALEKLTSQHRNVQCLIAFAHSPRLQRVFECHLSIISVPSQPRRTNVLPNADKWKRIITKIVPPNESIGGKWIEKETVSLLRNLGNHPKWDAPIHCECALIEYFGLASKATRSTNPRPRHSMSSATPLGPPYEENRQSEKGEEWKVVGRKEGLAISGKIQDEWKLVSPFSYIGVSKLSCSACQMWIEGYNKKGSPMFFTRGSHGKWYFPWAIPRFEETEPSIYMVNQITSIYYEHCRAKERLRTLSDGSNAAMDNLRTSSKRRTEDLASACLASMKL